MTEAEWLTSDNPELPADMLEALRNKGSARKRRLYACSITRYFWQALTDPSREAVAVAERYADGLASGQELLEAEKGAEAAYRLLGAKSLPWDAAMVPMSAAEAARYCCATKGYDPSVNADWYESREGECAPLEVIKLLCEGPGYMIAGLQVPLRDIFGNPFRPVAWDLAWMTTPAVRMAQAIYEAGSARGSLNADDLAGLADVLEAAGCTNAEILSHCRNPGYHTLGCWVVDLVLGKE
jgi:hypothetical protein